MAYLGWEQRDRLAPRFRRQLWDAMGFTPFPHQAAIWAALEGYELTEIPTSVEHSMAVMLDDKSIEQRMLLERQGGPARFAADLAAFKGGKSLGGAMFVAPELLIPGVSWDLVGAEYTSCEPEFGYILDALFSEQGFNLPLKKPDHAGLYAVSVQNRPRAGVMVCKLSNGSQVEARSYERKEGLKGKMRDGYLGCEVYQLPGIVWFTDIKQNLTARNGKMISCTTPDSAWLEIYHELGNDAELTEWFCVSGVARKQNPFTYSRREKEQDRRIMTREKHAIAHDGVLGQYVGSCYSYQRGQRVFNTETHPHLWKDPKGLPTRENCRIPVNWQIIGGGDTGSKYSSVVAAFSEADATNLFFLDELANYRYVATELEQDETMTLGNWYENSRKMSLHWGGDGSFWVDHNSQMKIDASISSGMTLLPARGGPEARTEILREYFQNDRVWFAPWLQILPYEIEMARYPPRETSTGVWRRIKEKDHTLDPAEHIAAQRGRGSKVKKAKKRTAIETLLGLGPPRGEGRTDPHGL